jgi:hypothetical protein
MNVLLAENSPRMHILDRHGMRETVERAHDLKALPSVGMGK